MKHLNNEEYEALLDHIDSSNHESEILIGLLLVTGMRQEELCMLTRSSFQEYQGTHSVYVIGAKGSRNRTLGLDNKVAEKLYSFIFPRVHTRPIASILSKSTNNNESLKVSLRRAWVSLRNKIIPSSSITLHGLRHTYAIRYLEVNSADSRAILELRKLLGHVSINSTIKYLEYLNEKHLIEKAMIAVRTKKGIRI